MRAALAAPSTSARRTASVSLLFRVIDATPLVEIQGVTIVTALSAGGAVIAVSTVANQQFLHRPVRNARRVLSSLMHHPYSCSEQRQLQPSSHPAHLQ